MGAGVVAALPGNGPFRGVIPGFAVMRISGGLTVHSDTFPGGDGGYAVDAAAQPVVFLGREPDQIYGHLSAVNGFAFRRRRVAGFIPHCIIITAGVDQQQVNVGIRAVVAAGAGAEQDDVVRPGFPQHGLGHDQSVGVVPGGGMRRGGVFRRRFRGVHSGSSPRTRSAPPRSITAR